MMLEVAVACLTASLVGSLHCAGMCGPLALVAVGAGPGSRPGAVLRAQFAYNGARGAGYVIIGAVLGLVGELANLAGTLAGLAPVAAGLAGVTLIVTGVLLVAKSLGLAPRRRGAAVDPGPVQRALRAVRARALRMPPTSRALALGATTALLPCGWLYAFFVAAAGTGSALGGALVMGSFWLGTVPVLATLGFGVEGLRRRFGPTLQLAASLALIAAGSWTLLGRTQLDALDLAARAGGPDEAPACCAPDDGPAPTPAADPEAPR